LEFESDYERILERKLASVFGERGAGHIVLNRRKQSGGRTNVCNEWLCTNEDLVYEETINRTDGVYL
jgi:hypothetical protein